MKNNKLIDFYTSKNDKSKYYVSTTEGKILELNDIYEIKSFKELKEESQEEFLKIPLSEHMKRYMDQGYSKKEAMKLVAKDRGVGKREIYQQLLEEE